MSPTTTEAKLFTMFMSIYGIIILGIFLGVAGEWVVEMHNKATERRQEEMRGQVAAKQLGRIDEEETVDTEPTLWEDIRSIVLLELPIMAVLVLVGLGVGYVEGWSFIDSIWWLVVGTFEHRKARTSTTSQASSVYT